MSEPRQYRGVQRQAKTAAARARVAEAALELFIDQGYAATSMEAIAGRAGVGLRTVYDLHASKVGILRALLESFARLPRPQFETEVEVLKADPRAQLRFLVQFAVDYFAAAEPLLDLISTSGFAQPELQSAGEQGERFRRSSQGPIVSEWTRRGVLRPGLSRNAAADILWAMTSPSLYLLFVRQRHWSRRRYSDWLSASVAELLFGASDG